MSNPPDIRLLAEPQEMLAVEELQSRVWGNTRVVPAHLLMALVHSGGIALGAYDGEHQIGFTFSFPGLTEERQLKQSSHMLAVDPAYQDRGVGYALKRAQWQMARSQGADLITWTFDPLMSKNAFLNLVKLGALAKTYIRDLYGDLVDDLNKGVATDRFMVEWWLNSDRVNTRLGKQARGPLVIEDVYSAGGLLVNESRLNQQSLPVPNAQPLAVEPLPGNRSKLLMVEIPSDFQALKEADLDLAAEWRLHTRAIFEELFDIGYIATDFIFLKSEHSRSFYLLTDGLATLGE